MLRRVSIAVLSLAAFGGGAYAQSAGNLLGLPTQPPGGGSNPVQEGAFVRVGPNGQGAPAVVAHGGQQAPVQALVSGDQAPPKTGAEVYARLPRGENGLPTGVDARLSATNQEGQQTFYRGVQLGQQ